MEDNRNDVVILKTSANPLRLPTYHLAHAVDDHLMRVTIVIRGDEWLSSVPVHLQLFDALSFARIPYAHVAPLMKQEGSKRRKLSKRRHPEASVEFYVAAGYPAGAIIYYLRGLANARLADAPMEAMLQAPLRLEKCSVAGPLFDLVKLHDIAGNYVASMPSSAIVDNVLLWAQDYDAPLARAVIKERDIALAALDIVRVGVDNPRKDLRHWSDFRAVYGYFFDHLFEVIDDPTDPRLGGLPPSVVVALCRNLLERYRHHSTSDSWFEQLREAAAAVGFAPSVSAFKDDPSAFVGSIRDAARVIRVLLTGSAQSPGLHLVAGVLGEDTVRCRIEAVVD